MNGLMHIYTLLVTSIAALYLLVVDVDAQVLLAQLPQVVESREAQAELTKQVELLADTRLTALCLIGAVAGGIIAVALWPPRDTESEAQRTRALAAKFGSSMFMGAGLTPAIIRLMNWPLSGDVALPCAMLVAMFSVAAVHATTPIVLAAWQRYVRRRLDIDLDGGDCDVHDPK